MRRTLRTSIQHIPRKERLSAKDLTRLIRDKSPGATVKYEFNEGWSIYRNQQPVAFIGNNWVEARTYIRQMPVTPKGIIHLLRKLIGDAL